MPKKLWQAGRAPRLLDDAAVPAPVAGQAGLSGEALELTDAEVAQIAHQKTDKQRVAQAYLIERRTGESDGVGAARVAGVLDLHLGPDRCWIAAPEFAPFIASGGG